MPSRSTQSRIDGRTNIPTHIQQAMDQHMQQSMPANLKKYTSGGTYIPASAQKAIAQQMEKTLPTHLKQYSGAYMEQKLVQPNTARLKGSVALPASHPGFHPPVPDHLRRDHSAVSAEQFTVDTNTLPESTPLFQPDQPQSATPEQPGVTPQQPATPTEPYDFIVNPKQPPKKSSLPGFSGNSSMAVKALVVCGGLFVLFIVFVLIKGVLGGGSDLTAYVGVAQDQQEIIHLITNASTQQSLSTTTQNFNATAGLSLNSAQSQLLTYLASNGQKVKTKTLILKTKASVDTQLTNAIAAANYDETYQDIMKTQLTIYTQDIQHAYAGSKGKKGHALLNDQFNQAKLLYTQLTTTN